MLDPVRVVWLDSVRHENGWRTAAWYASRAVEQDWLTHESVGFLVAESRHWLMVAGSRSLAREPNVAQVIQIPKRAVVSRSTGGAHAE